MVSTFMVWKVISNVIAALAIILPCVMTSRVRIVTWNTGDNNNMKDGFTDDALDKILGLDRTIEDADMPSIYAIGLQQQCWMCNKKNLPKIGKAFLTRINQANVSTKYEVVAVEGTRMRNQCEKGCTLGTHGSTVIVVIAKMDYVDDQVTFHQTNGCSNKMIPNPERGVAAVKLNTTAGKTICFSTVQLDPNGAKYKRNCLERFFQVANEKEQWSDSCSVQFLFGDFNTKTGENSIGTLSGLHLTKSTHFNALRSHDELTGVMPHGTDSKYEGNLLNFINSLQPKKFEERSFRFMPTYYIENAKKYCDDKFPCYRADRPLSWPDRILATCGKREKYDAIYAEYGTHFPVFAEFELFTKQIQESD